MENEEDDKIRDERERMEIDEKADFHSRLATLESAILRTNRRITKLEDNNRSGFSDDPMAQIFSPALMWAMVLLTIAPIVIELVKQWKSQSSSS